MKTLIALLASMGIDMSKFQGENAEEFTLENSHVEKLNEMNTQNGTLTARVTELEGELSGMTSERDTLQSANETMTTSATAANDALTAAEGTLTIVPAEGATLATRIGAIAERAGSQPAEQPTQEEPDPIEEPNKRKSSLTAEGARMHKMQVERAAFNERRNKLRGIK